MLRKISIVPILVAMMMVMMTTVVPHHHHQAMICLVKEVCDIGSNCDDEMHSHHSASDSEEDDNHCVSHEKYFPSSSQRVEFSLPSVETESIFPILAAIYCEIFGNMGESACTALSFTPLLPLVPPLPAAAPNAPPTLA
jgi:hypothetical protein